MRDLFRAMVDPAMTHVLATLAICCVICLVVSLANQRYNEAAGLGALISYFTLAAIIAEASSAVGLLLIVLLVVFLAFGETIATRLSRNRI